MTQDKDLEKTVRMSRTETSKSGDLAKTVRMDDSDRVARDPRRTQIMHPEHASRGIGWLVKAQKPARGQMHRIDRERAIIGAARDCDICIDEAPISDRHASIRVQGDGYAITDLDSTNGTFVNGQRIQQSELVDGDQVRFGDSEWVFKCLLFEAE